MPTTNDGFWSLSAFEQLQGPHHQRHIRCLSRVWSGTTLRRASVQLSKPSDATYSGTTRLRSQTSSIWTTDDRRRAAGLSQQQQYNIISIENIYYTRLKLSAERRLTCYAASNRHHKVFIILFRMLSAQFIRCRQPADRPLT